MVDEATARAWPAGEGFAPAEGTDAQANTDGDRNEWGKHPGLYSAPPPCVDPDERCGPICACRPFCEEARYCRSFGAIGIPEGKLLSWGLPRHRLMLIAGVLSFVGWLLLIPAAVGISTNRTAVYDLPWATANLKNGDGDDADNTLFINLAAAVVYTKDGDFVSKFDFADDSCAEDDDGFNFGSLPESACEACVSAATGLQTGAIVGLLTQLTQLLTDVQRSTVRGDVNCQKAMGVITGIFGLVVGLYTVAQFRKYCWGDDTDGLGKVDWETQDGYKVETRPGPGWSLTWFATAFKIVDVLAHLALPTPRHAHLPPTHYQQQQQRQQQQSQDKEGDGALHHSLLASEHSITPGEEKTLAGGAGEESDV